MRTMDKIRLWMRQYTRPVSQDEAESKNRMLSKLYALTGLLFFNYILYGYYGGNTDIYRTSKEGETVKHIRIHGLNHIEVSDCTQGEDIAEHKEREEVNEFEELKDPAEIDITPSFVFQ